MTSTARAVFTGGLILTALALTYAGALVIVQANEGCTTVTVCEVTP